MLRETPSLGQCSSKLMPVGQERTKGGGDVGLCVYYVYCVCVTVCACLRAFVCAHKVMLSV